MLIDFGMAHHARLPDLLAEQRRSAAGSAPYVSPEQVNGIRSDPRSDLFAVGVILYEMATGKLPFGAPQTVAGLRDRLWLDPAPPRQLVADVPHWLQQIICGCLEPAAAARYQSAAHVAFDLRHPEDVALDARAYRQRRAGVLEQLQRWWKARSGAGAPVNVRTQSAPVVMVAVDTMHPDDPRHDAIRNATERTLSLSADFRLICVSVVRGERVGGQPGAPGIHLGAPGAPAAVGGAARLARGPGVAARHGGPQRDRDPPRIRAQQQRRPHRDRRAGAGAAEAGVVALSGFRRDRQCGMQRAGGAQPR